jgi:hypothetical protein
MNLSIVKECEFLELQNSEDIIIFVQLRIQKNIPLRFCMFVDYMTNHFQMFYRLF